MKTLALLLLGTVSACAAPPDAFFRALHNVESSGRDLFRMDSDGLRVASGRSYNLICTPSTCLVRISAE